MKAQGVPCLPLALAALIAVAGCGSDRLTTVPAGGRVILTGGDPVRLGTIELESVEHGVTASGKIMEDGRFTLGTYDTADGAVAGEHRVIIMQMIINDGRVDHSKDHGKPVDPRFANYGTSGLTVTVGEDGSTDLTIEVEPAKKR